jgi:E3 ubiquitin-protein ligase HERC2
MVDLEQASVPGTLAFELSNCRDALPSSIRVPAWEAALDATAGNVNRPRVVLNRPRASRHADRGVPDLEGDKTLFSQCFRVMHPQPASIMRVTDRMYECVFAGLHSIDAGGPYRESFENYVAELHSPALSLLVESANTRSHRGVCADCWVPNPAARSPTEREMLRFLGKLMGAAIRSKNYVSVRLPPLVWRRIVGQEPLPGDLAAVCVDILTNRIEFVRNPTRTVEGAPQEMSKEEFESLDLFVWTAPSANGGEVELVPGGSDIAVRWEDREAYADAVLQFKLHEYDRQIAEIRYGLSTIVPVQLLTLFPCTEVERMVCGDPNLDVDLLRSMSTYDGGYTGEHQTIRFLWEVLEEWDPPMRSRFLRFCWGRSRLPPRAQWGQHRFKIQKAGGDASNMLPRACTCFFTLTLPEYTSKEMLERQFRVAIEWCGAIDGDGGGDGGNIGAWSLE